jgi:hypothetical protein
LFDRVYLNKIMTDFIILTVFVVATVIFALAVTATLGHMGRAIRDLTSTVTFLRNTRPADLETGTVEGISMTGPVNNASLTNPIFPDRPIKLTTYPQQESYTKPESPGTIIGPPLFP